MADKVVHPSRNASISVIMPALNEEENLAAAVENARCLVSSIFNDWEILIFNDGSQDATGAIADRLAVEDPHIKVTHHESPKNLGGVYRAGIQKASKDFCIMIPGDNENGSETLRGVLAMAGQAEMIIPYVKNTQVRPWKRRAISRLFVLIVNILSGCRLKYYNGTVLHTTALLKTLPLKTDGFGYSAEILVYLIRRGYSYKEVGVELASRSSIRSRQSKALGWGNLVKVAKFLYGLVVENRFGLALPASPVLRETHGR